MNDNDKSPAPDSILPEELASDTPLDSEQHLQPDVNAVNNITVETEPSDTDTVVLADEPNSSLPPTTNDTKASTEETKTDRAQKTPAPAVTSTPVKSDPKNTKIIIFITASILFIIAALIAILFLLKPEDPAPTNTSNTTNDQRQASPAPKIGIAVTLVDGTTEYSSDGEQWQELTTDSQLNEGDQVRTSNESRAILTLDDGSVVRLDALSRISIDSLEASNIIITHHEGNAYSRLVPSDRNYTVKVGDTEYMAIGTAFTTTNQSSKKGIQVYQSSVSVSGLQENVDQGSQYYELNPQVELTNKVTEINLDVLIDDKFTSWNIEKDEENQLFKDDLGVFANLKDIAEEKAKKAEEERKLAEAREKARKEAEEAERKAKEAAKKKHDDKGKITRGDISINTSPGNSSVVWSYTGKAPYGFKLVYSKDNKNPSFTTDDSVYYSNPESKTGELPKKADKNVNYYAIICAYTNGTEEEPCVDASGVFTLRR